MSADDPEGLRSRNDAFRLATILAVSLGIIWTCSLATTTPSRAQLSLSDTINPNSVSLGSLIRLPGIGPSRAQALLEFRRDHKPFLCAGDLERVPGIGPATVRQLAPYLSFSSKKTACAQ